MLLGAHSTSNSLNRGANAIENVVGSAEPEAPVVSTSPGHHSASSSKHSVYPNPMPNPIPHPRLNLLHYLESKP